MTEDEFMLSTLETITFPYAGNSGMSVSLDVFDYIKNNLNLKKLELVSPKRLFINNNEEISRIQLPSSLEVLDLSSITACYAVPKITEKIRLPDGIKELTVNCILDLRHLIMSNNIYKLRITHSHFYDYKCECDDIWLNVKLPENLQSLDVSTLTSICYNVPKSVNTLYCKVIVLHNIMTNNIQKLYLSNVNIENPLDLSGYFSLCEVHIMCGKYCKTKPGKSKLDIKVPYGCIVTVQP